MLVQSCCFAKYKPIDYLPFSMQISRSSRLRRGRQENTLRYLIWPRSLCLPFWTVREFAQNEKWETVSPPLSLASPFACGSLGNSCDSPKWRTCPQASLSSAHALFTATYTCFLARIEPLIRLILVNGFLSDSVEINSCVHNILKSIIIFNLGESWRYAKIHRDWK